MHEQEINNVMRLEASLRYKYSLKKIADQEFLYLLKSGSHFATSMVDSYNLIHLFPQIEFTELFKSTMQWDSYKAVKLDLDEVENTLFPIINENEYLVDIFPINGKSGFIVSLDEFTRDLNDELNKYL